jgi:hypothetical protein
MSENVPELNLTAVEAALSSLSPLPGRIDRDRLLFLAGQRTMSRRRWLWPSATAAMALMSLALGGLLAARPGTREIERVVYVRVPVAMPEEKVAVRTSGPSNSVEVTPADGTAQQIVGSNYLELEQQVLRWGLDVLPELPPSPVVEPPLTLDRLLSEKESDFFSSGGRP